MQGTNEYLFVCLSFNSYSTNGVSAIASKVRDEFINDLQYMHQNDDDFEFSSEFNNELDISAAEIQSVFPIFNREHIECVIRKNVSVKIPVEELVISDNEEHSSNTSSESGELEPTTVKTVYCFWRPKFVESLKKNRSIGQGYKPWKLRDLLKRSNSEGNGPFVFSISKQIVEKGLRSNRDEELTKKGRSSVECDRKSQKSEAARRPSPLHEMFYNKRNYRGEKDGRKRKSYLPYRPNIFSFFSGFNQ